MERENWKIFKSIDLLSIALEEDKKNSKVTENPLSKKLVHTVCEDDKTIKSLNASKGIHMHLSDFVEDLSREVNKYAYHHFGISEDRCEFQMNVAW